MELTREEVEQDYWNHQMHGCRGTKPCPECARLEALMWELGPDADEAEAGSSKR